LIAATGRTGTEYTYLNNTPVTEKLDELAEAIAAGGGGGGQVNVQSDWNETDPSSDAYIKNKPTIPEGYTILEGTLRTGETTITISNSAIKANSIIDIFAEGGLSYTDVTSTVGSVTITYPAQEADVGIRVILL
jgi:hypothetical protein